MTHRSSSIDLPPRRAIRRRKRDNRPPAIVWVCLLVAALAAGVTGGFLAADKRTGAGEERSEQGDPGEGRGMPDRSDVEILVADARASVLEGDWARAREIFEEVERRDPENRDARASLPLIRQRLAEVEGSLVVETETPGATVRIDGFPARETPAKFTGLPVGTHRVEVSRDGFETVVREVTVRNEEPLLLSGLFLTRRAGMLEVVSEPRGASFKVLKKENDELKELVQIGTTPAEIEELDAGEYQVLMEVEGWPEYSRSIRVETNRRASVSAVFAKGGLNLTSDPSNAEVWLTTGDANARLAGRTPCMVPELPVGRHVLELRYRDWKPIRRTVVVEEGVTQELAFAWDRSVVSLVSDPPGAEVRLGDKRLGDGNAVTPFSLELPEGEYELEAIHGDLAPVVRPLVIEDNESRTVRFPFSCGSVALESEPSGAAVVSNGTPVGRTPLRLEYVRPGAYTYELSKDGFRASIVSGTLEPGGSLRFNARMSRDPSPARNRHFTNGLGRRMIWFGVLDGWVAAKEVLQEDYERLMGENPSYFKAPNHPVDTVSWYKAAQFCERLTAWEKQLGSLPEGYRYRLPTDEEWSRFVGDAGLDQAITSLFHRQESTAPAGSLPPNEYGLFDVRGNVMEWCFDWYSQSVVNRAQREGATVNPALVGTNRKVLRGGSWNRSSQYDLSIENRVAAQPAAEDRYDVGLRVVLMPGGQ